MSVDYQSCLDAGMTAVQAALACGVTVSSAYAWAKSRGVAWHSTPYEPVTQLPQGMNDLPAQADCDLDAVACQSLWASVLRDQWFWVFGGHAAEYAGHHRIESLAWFGTRDCATVCTLAGMDFDYVMLKYQRRLAEISDAAQSRSPKPGYFKQRNRAQKVAA